MKFLECFGIIFIVLVCISISSNFCVYMALKKAKIEFPVLDKTMRYTGFKDNKLVTVKVRCNLLDLFDCEVVNK